MGVLLSEVCSELKMMVMKLGIVFLMMTNLWAPLARAEVWKVSTLDWPPYVCSSCPQNGAAAEALRTALKKEGVALEFSFYPWVQAQKVGAKPSFVGYFPAWKEEILKDFTPSESLFSSPVVFLQRRDKPLKWKELKDLAGKTFAVTEGYGYTEEFNALVKNKTLKVISVLGEKATLDRLLKGGVDGVLIDYRVAQYYLKQEARYAEALEIHPKIVEVKNLYFAFNDVNKEKKTKLAQALKTFNFSKAVDGYLIQYKKN